MYIIRKPCFNMKFEHDHDLYYTATNGGNEWDMNPSKATVFVSAPFRLANKWGGIIESVIFNCLEGVQNGN